MKAAIEINIKNEDAFEDGVFISDKGLSSYFVINVGEDLSESLKEKGFSEEKIKDIETRLLKFCPERLVLETPKEEKKAKEIKEDKKQEQERFEKLKLLSKSEQVEMLSKLGLDKKEISSLRLEVDRIKMIMRLEDAR